jgi:hypothetical protein
MTFRRWRPVLAVAVAAVAVAVGMVATAPSASAAPIPNPGQAGLMATSEDGIGYCLLPSGWLEYNCPPPRQLYTFVTKSCGSSGGVCYQLQIPGTNPVNCVYYDTGWGGILGGVCHATSLAHRWHVDALNNYGKVRLRPASHPNKCVVYDPAEIYEHPHTYVDVCSSYPLPNKSFSLIGP